MDSARHLADTLKGVLHRLFDIVRFAYSNLPLMRSISAPREFQLIHLLHHSVAVRCARHLTAHTIDEEKMPLPVLADEVWGSVADLHGVRDPLTGAPKLRANSQQGRQRVSLVPARGEILVVVRPPEFPCTQRAFHGLERQENVLVQWGEQSVRSTPEIGDEEELGSQRA